MGKQFKILSLSTNTFSFPVNCFSISEEKKHKTLNTELEDVSTHAVEFKVISMWIDQVISLGN